MLNIETLPIAFHCKQCLTNFRKSNLRSYPVACPSCSKESTSFGFLKLPTNRFYVGEPKCYDIFGRTKNCQVYVNSFTKQSFAFLIGEDEINSFQEEEFEDMSGSYDKLLKLCWSKREALKKFFDEECIPYESLSEQNRIINKNEENLIKIYELWKEVDLDVGLIQSVEI